MVYQFLDTFESNDNTKWKAVSGGNLMLMKLFGVHYMN